MKIFKSIFTDPHDKTIATYEQKFDMYVQQTLHVVIEEMNSWIDNFLGKVCIEGKIFEIGSGFGRDAAYMVNKGFKVLCSEVTDSALHKLQQQKFETIRYDFREKPSDNICGTFDGVFANAVLLHATESIFKQALYYMLSLIKCDGYLAFSLKYGEGEEVVLEKLNAPRFFKYYKEPELRTIFSMYPVEILLLKITNDKNGYT